MIGFQKAKVCIQDKNELIDLEEIVSDYSLQIKKNTLIPEENREKLENFTQDLLDIQLTKDNKKNKTIYNEKMKVNPTPAEKRKEYNRKTYLRRKEKLKKEMEEKQNTENI